MIAKAWSNYVELGVLCLVLGTAARPAIPPADSVEPHRAEDVAATRIDCGTVITVPGTYVLMRDLECSGMGVTIAGSNVTLDLAGHSITSTSSHPSRGAGVSVEGNVDAVIHGVRVQNGAISGFETGIGTSSARAVIENLTVTSSRWGVLAADGGSTRVQRSRLDGNAYGVMVLRGAAADLAHVDIRDSGEAAAWAWRATLHVASSSVAQSTAQGVGIVYDEANGNVTDSTVVFQGSSSF
jgi:hypothetical protein